jgi:uncharacterized protein with HEPN domain
MDSKAYPESEVVRSAVERKFEIIGEALAQLAKREPEIANRIPNFGEIISFRNILIHGYATKDDDRVYRVTQRSLQRLRDAVVATQAELPS